MAVLAVLLVPLGVMTSGGLLLPVGLLIGLVTVALAALVLARTSADRWPRRFGWALLVFALIPWAFAFAVIVDISFFETTQTIPLPTG